MSLLVQADRVRVEFGALVAVCDLSIELRAGDLVGLIGPNGAGKTTLLRVLAGLQAPTAGEVRILGHDLFHHPERVRGQVGFAPDSPPAYEDLTVEEFLMFVADAFDVSGAEAVERLDFWLDQVWLQDKRGEKIKTLSRGMRQRVTIAQTLVPNPTVVLLDEPSSGLDPAGRVQLRQVIASLRDMGKAVIVSSHILADLEEYCTHIAIIERGRLLRFAHVGELSGRAAERCAYEATVAAQEDLSEAFMAQPGVSHVVRTNHAYRFDYLRGEAEGAGLLRALIERGVPISSFRPIRESLEDVYLKAGVRQVD